MAHWPLAPRLSLPRFRDRGTGQASRQDRLVTKNCTAGLVVDVSKIYLSSIEEERFSCDIGITAADRAEALNSTSPKGLWPCAVDADGKEIGVRSTLTSATKVRADAAAGAAAGC